MRKGMLLTIGCLVLFCIIPNSQSFNYNFAWSDYGWDFTYNPVNATHYSLNINGSANLYVHELFYNILGNTSRLTITNSSTPPDTVNDTTSGFIVSTLAGDGNLFYYTDNISANLQYNVSYQILLNFEVVLGTGGSDVFYTSVNSHSPWNSQSNLINETIVEIQIENQTIVIPPEWAVIWEMIWPYVTGGITAVVIGALTWVRSQFGKVKEQAKRWWQR